MLAHILDARMYSLTHRGGHLILYVSVARGYILYRKSVCSYLNAEGKNQLEKSFLTLMLTKNVDIEILRKRHQPELSQSMSSEIEGNGTSSTKTYAQGPESESKPRHYILSLTYIFTSLVASHL